MNKIPRIERLSENDKLNESPRRWAEERESVSNITQQKLAMLMQTVEQRAA